MKDIEYEKYLDLEDFLPENRVSILEYICPICKGLNEPLNTTLSYNTQFKCYDPSTFIIKLKKLALKSVRRSYSSIIFRYSTMINKSSSNI